MLPLTVSHIMLPLTVPHYMLPLAVSHFMLPLALSHFMLPLTVHFSRYRNTKPNLLSLIHWRYVDVNSNRLNSVRHGTVTPHTSYGAAVELSTRNTLQNIKVDNLRDIAGNTRRMIYCKHFHLHTRYKQCQPIFGRAFIQRFYTTLISWIFLLCTSIRF